MRLKNLLHTIWEVISPVLVIVLVSFVVQVVAVMLAVPMDEYAMEVSAVGASFAIPLLAFMIAKEKEKVVVGEKNISYILIFVLSVAYTMIANVILMVGPLMEYSKTYQEVASIIYTPSFPMQLVCVGVILPVAEELAFRGLVYTRLKKRVGALLSIMISAVLFGLYHGNVVQFAYAVPAGLWLAYIMEKKKTVVAPVFAHVVMNITSCVATQYGWFEMILKW